MVTSNGQRTIAFTSSSMPCLVLKERSQTISSQRACVLVFHGWHLFALCSLVNSMAFLCTTSSFREAKATPRLGLERLNTVKKAKKEGGGLT